MSVERPVDGPEFERWREEADRALASARLQAREDLHNWACFSAEQAAQLAVKALLHGLGQGPWGHDLVKLGETVRATGIEVPTALFDAIRRVGRHYIPARYPDAHPEGPPGGHYGAADSEQAIADCELILDFVDRAWEEASR